MTPDALAGYRAIDRDDEDLAPVEALLKRQMADNAKLIQLVTRSEALDQWMQSPAGAALQQETNLQLDAAMTVWLTCTDPGSPEARKAHFDARVAVGMMKLVEKILTAGPEARRAVAASDTAANAEMNDA